MPLWLLANWKLILAGVLAIALSYATQRITAKIYEGDIAALKLDYEHKADLADKKAAALLLAKTEEKAAVEHQLAELKDKVEAGYAERDAKIKGDGIALGRFLAATGGLFDKNGRPSGRPSSGNGVPGDPSGAGNPEAAATGCKLSSELTEFLRSEAARADEAANTAIAGIEYANGMPAAAIAPPH